MPVDHTRDHDSRQSDTIRDLAQCRPGVPKSGRNSIAACIRVDDDTSNQVEGRVRDLQGVQCFREVLSMRETGVRQD